MGYYYIRNGKNWSKLVQIGPNVSNIVNFGSRWSNLVKNRPKWSNILLYCLKWQNMVKIWTTKLSQWVRHITRSPGLVFIDEKKHFQTCLFNFYTECAHLLKTNKIISQCLLILNLFKCLTFNNGVKHPIQERPLIQEPTKIIKLTPKSFS